MIWERPESASLSSLFISFLFYFFFTKQRSQSLWKMTWERKADSSKRETRGEKVLASQGQTQGATVLTGKGLQSCWCHSGALTAERAVRVHSKRDGTKESNESEGRGEGKKETLSVLRAGSIDKVPAPRVIHWKMSSYSYHLWQFARNKYQFPFLWETGFFTSSPNTRWKHSSHVCAITTELELGCV